MRNLFQLVALLMLALWLPVTQHCVLVAAGVELGSCCDDEPAACGDLCDNDPCDTIEGVSFVKAGHALRTLPPPESALGGWLLHLLQPPLAPPRDSVVAVDDPPEVRALLRTWSFVRRSALPARAPDFVV